MVIRPRRIQLCPSDLVRPQQERTLEQSRTAPHAQVRSRLRAVSGARIAVEVTMAFTLSTPKVLHRADLLTWRARRDIRSSNRRCLQVQQRAGGRAVVARAQKGEVAKQASTAFAAAALASVISVGTVDAAYADVAGLTPCSESKGFAKAQKSQLKKLEKRKKLVRFRL